MSTALGYGSAGGLTFPVKNTGASTIPKGAVVSLKGTSPAIPSGDDDVVIEVELAGTPVKFCGIANSPMSINGGGTITQFGPVLCFTTSAALATLTAIKVESSGYKVLAQGGSGTIMGVSLGAKHVSDVGPDYGANTDTYATCWVNFISSLSFGYT